MTITRLRQIGFELNSLAQEIDTFNVSASCAIVSDIKRTGNYSLVQASNNPVSWVTPTITQCRVSMHMRHRAFANTPNIISLLTAGTTEVCRVRWNGSQFQIVQASSTVINSYTYAPFALTDTWFHISADFKIDGSAGWVRFAVDGIEVFNWTGDNNNGGANFDRVRIGGDWGSGISTNGCHYDDIYIENTTGEATASIAPDRRFPLVAVDGNGPDSAWVGSDGDSVDNFLLVDETPHDGDTTYVGSGTVGERGSHTVNPYTLPAGWTVAAVIPYAWAKKDSAGSTAAKLFTKVGAGENLSAAKTIGTDYSYIWDRQLTKPAGGAWDQAALDALVIGYEHA